LVSGRELVDRPGDFLELRVGYRLRLDHVHWGHGPGNPVAAEEQALAPDQAVAPRAHRQGTVGQLTVPVDKGIQQFTVATVQLLGVVGEFVVTHRPLVGAGRVVVVVAVLVHGVVPGGAAQTGTEVVKTDVQLGKNVQAIGDQPLAEVVVAVILVQRRLALAEFAAGILQPPGRAVLQRVVPTQAEIGIAGIDLEGLGSRSAKPQARSKGQGKGDAPRRSDLASSHRSNPLIVFFVCQFFW